MSELQPTLMDINDGAVGSSPQFLTAVGDKLYFTANNGVDGSELFVLDTAVEGQFQQ